jgi:hypothetical protein
MLAAVTAGVGHPAVASLLALGAAGLAGAVVAMTWSVHVRQIRLAELLARRQGIVTAETAAPGHALNGHGDPEAALGEVQEALEAAAAQSTQRGQKSQGVPVQENHGGRGAASARAAKLIIEGPETVVVGEQVRYRVRPSGNGKVVTWAAGGGSVSQAPDPAHPDELFLIADRPGELMLHARVREGLSERRETKSVTAVPDVTPAASPFPLRLFLHGWSLVVVAILIVGFAGALDALGNLTSADFIAMVVPLTALLAVMAVARGSSDPSPRVGSGKNPARPEA